MTSRNYFDDFRTGHLGFDPYPTYPTLLFEDGIPKIDLGDIYRYVEENPCSPGEKTNRPDVLW